MSGEPAQTVTRALPVMSELGDRASPDEQAEAAGLTYVTDDEPGLTRVRRGKGFSYHRPDGELIEGEERERIESLAIPPAWTDVWIAPDPAAHLLATGRDDAGRKQYLYHPAWRNLREAAKFHRLDAVATSLPTIRDTVDAHLRKRTLSREKILALVVALLDETLIRIGNEQYARTNGARGLTTLEADHVAISGQTVQFSFPGKSGQDREVELRHRRLARQLLRIDDAPGRRVFAYERGGTWQNVDSDDVNDYLREIAGADVTAKDFRTWGGTVTAAEKLLELGDFESLGEADTNILAAVDSVAERLGNTRAVARASYVHPLVPKAYRFRRFVEHFDDDEGTVDRLNRVERGLPALLALDLPPSDDLEAQLRASLD